MQEKEGSRELFISYSTEDKESIARPVANALVRQDFSVRFDEFELKIGDSIRESIDKGLSQSSYGVVILSPSYFERYWTMAELNALAARESNGKKVILPVWHNVDKDYVLKKSPLLADRFAARSSDGVENIVRMISAKIRKDAPGTVMAEMEGILSALENKKVEEMKQVISQEDFAKLRKEYRNVLCGIGFFDISPTPSNINIFRYLREAIVNRPENEAKALFEVLLEWYVETTTPFSNEMLLEIFSGLVKLPFAKDAVREKKFSKLFVTEFGKSHNWDRALITTQILVNIQSLLSKSEKARIVEYIISNDQIYSSYAAKGYLQKLLDYFEGDVDPGRLDSARKSLG